VHLWAECPSRPHGQATAAAAGVADTVIFHGRVDHDGVMARLAACHAFVFPTRVAEGFPKAVLEAMASALPVIASRVSVIPELLKDGAGVLLDATDGPAVSEALAGLLARPDALPAMGQAARAASLAFTLEHWRDTIAGRLEAAWGQPTRRVKA